MSAKKTVTEQEYREVLLNILLEVDKFCRINNIEYFLTGGTLLGAVRHKGFIPWDDDIDICMKRKDYDRFCASFKSDNKQYEIITIQNNKRYYIATAKVIDKRIKVHEQMHGVCEIGAYIDVFPMDYLNCSYEVAAEYLDKNNIYNKIAKISHFELNKRRPIYKNLIIILSRILYPFSLRHDALKKDQNNKKLISNEPTSLMANLYGAWRKKEITKSEFFTDSVEIQFEGNTLMAPVGYDGYLRGVYGNYMELPPKEKRVSHHSFDAYWA